MFNCTSRYKTLESIETGRVFTLGVSEPTVFNIDDTLLVKEGKTNLYVYGKYIGVKPNDSITFNYDIVKVIK